MKATYEQIINAQDVALIAKQERIVPANKDVVNRLLICIDNQNDFMDDGALGVPGALNDVENLAKWLYINVGKITNIVYSLDTHNKNHIFFTSWWRDEFGKEMKPFTIITCDEFINGKYCVADINKYNISIAYLNAIEKKGKQLCVWPYHCIEGTKGAELQKRLERLFEYYSIVRDNRPIEVVKGLDPYSEMYGILQPEYNPNAYFNIDVVEQIKKADEVYLAGEAASHCLMESLVQILEYFKNEPDVCKKIVVLSDCTSPIAGYEQYTNDMFDKLIKQYGIRVMKSVDVRF